MSKLPSVSARQVIRVAEELGFAFDRQKGSHAVYLRSTDRRRLVVPIHKGRTLKPGTLRGLIDDMGLSVEEFTAMLSTEARNVPAEGHSIRTTKKPCRSLHVCSRKPKLLNMNLSRTAGENSIYCQLLHGMHSGGGIIGITPGIMIGNKAAHGRFDQYTKQDVVAFHEFVQRLLATII